MPEWLPPVEVAKAVAQLVAVTVGVFLGWRLNGRSQQRDRVRQARADWAGAAEECLAAMESHHAAWARYQAGAGGGGDDGERQSRADLIQRRSVFDDAKARYRAATMRLILVDARVTGVDVLATEDDILAIERVGTHEIYPKLKSARGRVRSIVAIWTGRPEKTSPAKETSGADANRTASPTSR